MTMNIVKGGLYVFKHSHDDETRTDPWSGAVCKVLRVPTDTDAYVETDFGPGADFEGRAMRSELTPVTAGMRTVHE